MGNNAKGSQPCVWLRWGIARAADNTRQQESNQLLKLSLHTKGIWYCRYSLAILRRSSGHPSKLRVGITMYERELLQYLPSLSLMNRLLTARYKTVSRRVIHWLVHSPSALLWLEIPSTTPAPWKIPRKSVSLLSCIIVHRRIRWLFYKKLLADMRSCTGIS